MPEGETVGVMTPSHPPDHGCEAKRLQACGPF